MKNFWQKLKKRWGIENDWQVAIILLVFALTGFTFLYVRPWIDRLFGLSPEDAFWLKALVFIVILLPVYNILLIIWGTLLGQYKFFRNFIIKFFSRMLSIRKKKTKPGSE
ncbi:MAG: prolipoprotein diacylglyceryl transferase [bacterium]|jgi:uncharacterized protein involved in cysteine biosynthesis